MSEEQPVIGVTIGDPGGIGAQIALMSALDESVLANIIIIGAESAVKAGNEKLNLGAEIRAIENVEDATFGDGTIPMLHVDNITEHEFGLLRAEYGAASVEYLSIAIELAMEGKLDGVVGGPLNRTAIDRSDSEFAGPEELILESTGLDHYSIMLLTDGLRVTHVTPEIALEEAIDMITEDLVLQTIERTARELERMGVDDPEIAVAGLEPHAGLDGLYGHKDGTEIEPAVERAQSDGIDAFGPESPDSVFAAAINRGYDCVVTMYHDQGHIPIKTIGFRKDERRVAVVPLNMPFPYGAVGHGTAFSTAARGTGASEASLTMSIKTIAKMIRNED